MSGFYNQSDSDLESEFEQSNSGGGLRKMLEDALGEIKDLKKQLNSEKREQSTADLLKDKGLDPAIAELIPADMEPTAWLEKYSHLLGVPSAPADEAPAAPEVRMADDSDPAIAAEREALAAMQDAAESGSPAVPTTDALERLNKFEGTVDELEAFFRSGGLG